MASAENTLARLARARQKDIPELIIRIEQALEAYGNADLFEPALERLRQLDEDCAKSQDDVLELYREIGGKPRT